MTSGDMHLRFIGPQDTTEVHRLFCVPDVYKYLADGQEPPPDVASAWVNGGPIDARQFGGGFWGLRGLSEQRIDGVARLAGDSNGELELTYVLHPEFWGSGYATRMAHTVMNLAFEARLVPAIWAGADVPNVASIAVMKRLGMKFRRDVQYPAGAGVEYVINADDFDRDRFDCLPIA